MKIKEIIEPTDLFDIIKHPALAKLDKMFSQAEATSAEFTAPAAMMNGELRQELMDEIELLGAELRNSSIGSEWKSKFDQLRTWINKG